MAFGALIILVPGHPAEAEARSRAGAGSAAGLGVAGLVAVLGKAVLHMPLSAQLATLSLCGLTVGLAGLASYRLLACLLLPAEAPAPLAR
jgi:hypothetical protein